MAGRPTMASLLVCFLFIAAAAVAISAGEMAPAPSAAIDHDPAHNNGAADNHKGNNDGKGNLKPSHCGGECERRCSRTHHRKPCLFFCNKCCAKCLCVPPGCYGNKETCPCYNNWKNKRGGPKCP